MRYSVIGLCGKSLRSLPRAAFGALIASRPRA